MCVKYTEVYRILLSSPQEELLIYTYPGVKTPRYNI